LLVSEVLLEPEMDFVVTGIVPTSSFTIVELEMKPTSLILAS
jgi:hypothetical protein